MFSVCFCKKEKREVDCVLENQGILEFSCSQICALNLACGNHRCEDVCHPAECKPCQLTPDLITHCPCGQTELSSDLQDKRKSCLDKIPTCEKICGKKLPCGQPSKPHGCKSKCHSGLCPVCPLSTMVRCRCGHMDRELPCDQLTSKADDARCEKKCTKKRSCAKHKCNQLCCIEVDHPCPLPCNHTLSCGLHRCENLCHRGHCRPCWRTSFDELFCECGTEVIYPPVPCGTKPPTCSRPCPRQHDCEHPALHTCHSEPNCPPCTVLTQKYCYGNHEVKSFLIFFFSFYVILLTLLILIIFLRSCAKLSLVTKMTFPVDFLATKSCHVDTTNVFSYVIKEIVCVLVLCVLNRVVFFDILASILALHLAMMDHVLIHHAKNR